MPLLDYEEMWAALKSDVVQYLGEIQDAANNPKDWPDFKLQQGKLQAAHAIWTTMRQMELPREEQEVTNGAER